MGMHCDTCNNLKEVICPDCRGSAIIEVSCFQCNGSGNARQFKSADEYVEYPCRDCNASGHVIERCLRCSAGTVNSSGKVSCPACCENQNLANGST